MTGQSDLARPYDITMTPYTDCIVHLKTDSNTVMPLCYCNTNLPDSAIPKGFEEKFAKLISKVFPDKPIGSIAVIVIPGARVYKSGSSDPAMVIRLVSIETFRLDRNADYFTRFFDFLVSELKLPENRFVIEFIDTAVGYARSGK